MDNTKRVSAWREASNEKVLGAIDTIMRELNGGSTREIAGVIADRIKREHRTLQASFWSAMLLAQIDYATSGFDLRNEAAVRFAEDVRQLAIQKNVDMGFPFV
jgi:hypothetical protein